MNIKIGRVRDKRLTNTSAPVRIENDKHSDVTSESIAMLSHLAHYSANAFSLVKCLHQIHILYNKPTLFNNYSISNEGSRENKTIMIAVEELLTRKESWGQR